MAPWQPRGDAGRGVTFDCAWRSLSPSLAALLATGGTSALGLALINDGDGFLLGEMAGISGEAQVGVFVQQEGGGHKRRLLRKLTRGVTPGVLTLRVSAEDSPETCTARPVQALVGT